MWRGRRPNSRPGAARRCRWHRPAPCPCRCAGSRRGAGWRTWRISFRTTLELIRQSAQQGCKVAYWAANGARLLRQSWKWRTRMASSGLDRTDLQLLAELQHRGRLTNAELARSEEHTSELQSLMRISYAVFCLKKKQINTS